MAVRIAASAVCIELAAIEFLAFLMKCNIVPRVAQVVEYWVSWCSGECIQRLACGISPRKLVSAGGPNKGRRQQRLCDEAAAHRVHVNGHGEGDRGDDMLPNVV
jgi:hypothetical protein